MPTMKELISQARAKGLSPKEFGDKFEATFGGRPKDFDRDKDIVQQVAERSVSSILGKLPKKKGPTPDEVRIDMPESTEPDAVEEATHDLYILPSGNTFVREVGTGPNIEEGMTVLPMTSNQMQQTSDSAEEIYDLAKGWEADRLAKGEEVEETTRLDAMHQARKLTAENELLRRREVESKNWERQLDEGAEAEIERIIKHTTGFVPKYESVQSAAERFADIAKFAGRTPDEVRAIIEEEDALAIKEGKTPPSRARAQTRIWRSHEFNKILGREIWKMYAQGDDPEVAREVIFNSPERMNALIEKAHQEIADYQAQQERFDTPVFGPLVEMGEFAAHSVAQGTGGIIGTIYGLGQGMAESVAWAVDPETKREMTDQWNKRTEAFKRQIPKDVFTQIGKNLSDSVVGGLELLMAGLGTYAVPDSLVPSLAERHTAASRAARENAASFVKGAIIELGLISEDPIKFALTNPDMVATAVLPGLRFLKAQNPTLFRPGSKMRDLLDRAEATKKVIGQAVSEYTAPARAVLDDSLAQTSALKTQITDRVFRPTKMDDDLARKEIETRAKDIQAKKTAEAEEIQARVPRKVEERQAKLADELEEIAANEAEKAAILRQRNEAKVRSSIERAKNYEDFIDDKAVINRWADENKRRREGEEFTELSHKRDAAVKEAALTSKEARLIKEVEQAAKDASILKASQARMGRRIDKTGELLEGIDELMQGKKWDEVQADIKAIRAADDPLAEVTTVDEGKAAIINGLKERYGADNLREFAQLRDIKIDLERKLSRLESDYSKRKLDAEALDQVMPTKDHVAATKKMAKLQRVIKQQDAKLKRKADQMVRAEARRAGKAITMDRRIFRSQVALDRKVAKMDAKLKKRLGDLEAERANAERWAKIKTRQDINRIVEKAPQDLERVAKLMDEAEAAVQNINASDLDLFRERVRMQLDEVTGQDGMADFQRNLNAQLDPAKVRARTEAKGELQGVVDLERGPEYRSTKPEVNAVRDVDGIGEQAMKEKLKAMVAERQLDPRVKKRLEWEIEDLEYMSDGLASGTLVNKGLKKVIETEAAFRGLFGPNRPVNRLLSMAKKSATSLRVKAHIGNITSNVVLQAITRGDITIPAKWAQAAMDLMDFKSGKMRDAAMGQAPGGDLSKTPDSVLQARQKMRAFEAMESVKLANTTLVAAELGRLGGAGLIDVDRIPDRFKKSKAFMKFLNKPFEGLEKTYNQGDLIPKMEQFLHSYNHIDSMTRKLEPGNSMTMKVTPSRSVEIVRGADGSWSSIDIINGKYTGKQKGISLEELNTIKGRYAKLAADNRFHDYSDQSKWNQFITSNAAFGLGAPFFTWAWKSVDLPGAKKGLVSRSFEPNPPIKSTQQNIKDQVVVQELKGAVNKLLFLSAVKGQTAQDPELLKQLFTYGGKRVPTAMIKALADPSVVAIKDYQSSSPFGPSIQILSFLGALASGEKLPWENLSSAAGFGTGPVHQLITRLTNKYGRGDIMDAFLHTAPMLGGTMGDILKTWAETDSMERSRLKGATLPEIQKRAMNRYLDGIIGFTYKLKDPRWMLKEGFKRIRSAAISEFRETSKAALKDKMAAIQLMKSDPFHNPAEVAEEMEKLKEDVQNYALAEKEMKLAIKQRAMKMVEELKLMTGEK